MTKELTENKRHQICLEAIKAKFQLENDALTLAKMLYEIRENRYFEAGWTSWEEYTLEFKMSASSISRLIRIHELLVLKYDLKPAELASAGGWTLLGDMLPTIKPETPRERVLELVELAKGQTRSHFQETLKGVKRGSYCSHKKTHKVVVEYCDDCGARVDAHSHHES